MKNLPLLTICLLIVAGCGPKDKYDIAAEHADKGSMFIKPEMVDAKDVKLPEGANVEEVTIKKGDKMPDGKIATEDTKIKQFTMPMGGNTEFKVAK